MDRIELGVSVLVWRRDWNILHTRDRWGFRYLYSMETATQIGLSKSRAALTVEYIRISNNDNHDEGGYLQDALDPRQPIGRLVRIDCRNRQGFFDANLVWGVGNFWFESSCNGQLFSRPQPNSSSRPPICIPSGRSFSF